MSCPGSAPGLIRLSTTLAGLDLPALGYEVGEVVAGERATHVVIGKGGDT